MEHETRTEKPKRILRFQEIENSGASLLKNALLVF